MPKPKVDEIKKLFRDKKTYGDDLVLDLGNGATMTLGDLRAYDDELEGGLQAEMKRQKDDLEQERGKVKKAAEEVANLYLAVEAREKELGKGPAKGREEDPFAELQSDPLAKVLKGFMDEVRGELKSTKGELEKVSKNLTQAGRTYMNDLVRGQYEGLRKDPDFSDEITLDGVFDYAVKRGLKREDGIPDVKEAYDRMVQPKRTERLVKEAEARGRKAAEEEQRRAAFMPPPGAVNSSIISPRDRMAGDPKQPPKTIREAVARAATDPTIFGFKNDVN